MKNIKFRNFTITKREILVSIVIAALMIMFGFLISTKWSESQQESDIKYNKAIQIDNDTDLFQYGMDTNVGICLWGAESSRFSYISGNWWRIHVCSKSRRTL